VEALADFKAEAFARPVGQRGWADRVARRLAALALCLVLLLAFLREDNPARPAAGPAGLGLGEVQAELSAAVGVAVPGSVA
jgi:hypothetical protein